MRTLDIQRGVTTLLAVGAAGCLIWLATQVGQQTTGRFWASMGIVAGAGLVMAASQLVGGWTKFGMPRFSLGVFLLAFLPVLISTVWVTLATQPGDGWQDGRLSSWSETLGIKGFVYSIGLYHGVLAFAFGLVLGFCFDTRGRREGLAVTPAAGAVISDEPAAADQDSPAERSPVAEGSRGAVGSGMHAESQSVE